MRGMEQSSLRRWAARAEARNAAIDCIKRLHDRNRSHTTIG